MTELPGAHVFLIVDVFFFVVVYHVAMNHFLADRCWLAECRLFLNLLNRLQVLLNLFVLHANCDVSKFN